MISFFKYLVLLFFATSWVSASASDVEIGKAIEYFSSAKNTIDKKTDELKKVLISKGCVTTKSEHVDRIKNRNVTYLCRAGEHSFMIAYNKDSQKKYISDYIAVFNIDLEKKLIETTIRYYGKFNQEVTENNIKNIYYYNIGKSKFTSTVKMATIEMDSTNGLAILILSNPEGEEP